MAKSFEIDLASLLRGLDVAIESVADGAKRGMHGALDDWQAKARDLAPIDKTTLRRSISVGEIEQSGANLSGEITANATEVHGKKRFNYAYYIHENNAGGKSLRVPGTEKQFLDVALEQNDKKWIRGIETEIKEEIKRKGW